MTYYVYMLASDRNGILYVGVTSDLIRRVWLHRNNVLPGFTRDKQVHDLVWYEIHNDIVSAIRREKLIKRWKRFWKTRLIEEANPYWRDLFDDICR